MPVAPLALWPESVGPGGRAGSRRLGAGGAGARRLRPAGETGRRGRLGDVLLPKRLWPAIAEGSVTVAFRRWTRPSVKTGGTLQSPVGLLAIDAVDAITVDDVEPADARLAGFGDVAALLASLRPQGQLYRICFHRIGDDPRVALRAQAELADPEWAELARRVARLEWAVPVLTLIAARPAVVSTVLAEELGMERLPFKQRVRRLKELGLTESLKVGYRLSPRGEAFLARCGDGNA